MCFSNKVVVITGASSGMGEAIAIAFAEAKAKVVVVDKMDMKEKTLQVFKKLGSMPFIIKADLTEIHDLKLIVEKTIEEYENLDVLVNCAGVLRNGGLIDGTLLDTYDQIMDINLRAPIYLTSMFAPYLTKTKGSIVNISSVAAKCVTPHIAYCTSKAGLNHFTRSAALELAVSGIRVNAVMPGAIQTTILDNAGHTAEEADKIWNDLRTWVPLGNLPETKDIANLVLFLASDKARSITGSLFTCDSGYLLKL